MAARYTMRQLNASRLSRQGVFVAGALATGAALQFNLPFRTLHAEEPQDTEADLTTARKPIYDSTPLALPSATLVSSAPPVSTPETPEPTTARTSPTPTDRLATQIGHARLAVHSRAQQAENALDNFLTSSLNLERSLASTIASLAPPQGSGERLLPGGIYVLVAAMGGSIISRNRNILLRFSVPVAVGLGAAYTILPLTMRNVGDLVWEYEKRYPALADSHERVRERVTRFIETGKAHAGMSVGMLEDKVGEAREKVEGWVKQGK